MFVVYFVAAVLFTSAFILIIQWTWEAVMLALAKNRSKAKDEEVLMP